MGASLGGSDDEPISTINVVPLVDIILVVLIIFMVTAPLVLNPVIEINLPNSAVGDDSPQKPFFITVTPDGQLFLNKQLSNLESITAYASDLAKAQPDTAAILSADRSVTLDVLTQVISAVKSAGIRKVAFAVQRSAAPLVPPTTEKKIGK